MSKQPPAGPLCTRSSIVDDLRRLGLQAGDAVLVHSSLSSIGWVCGGAETVVWALLDVLGPEGTLVVPTHSGDNSDPALWENPPVPQEWWETIRRSHPPYDSITTSSFRMGRVAEAVRTWPGALRSAHPRTSFAAVGPAAGFVTTSHAMDCQLGEASPLSRLEDIAASVLLLGVGFDVCTAFHLAEYRQHRDTRPMVDTSFAIRAKDGSRKWVTVQDVDVSNNGFEALGEALRRETRERGLGTVKVGHVGAAEVMLFPVAEAVAFAQEWLPRFRDIGLSSVD